MDWNKAVQAQKTGEIVKTMGDLVWRVLDVDPKTGTIEYHVYDLSTDIVTHQTEQNIEQLARWTEEARKTDYAAHGIKQEFMHAARIPNELLNRWKRRGFDALSPDERDQKELKKRLNSSEYKWLRTGGQRL